MTNQSSETGCVFCTMANGQLVATNRLAYGVRDISR